MTNQQIYDTIDWSAIDGDDSEDESTPGTSTKAAPQDAATPDPDTGAGPDSLTPSTETPQGASGTAVSTSAARDLHTRVSSPTSSTTATGSPSLPTVV